MQRATAHDLAEVWFHLLLKIDGERTPSAPSVQQALALALEKFLLRFVPEDGEGFVFRGPGDALPRAAMLGEKVLYEVSVDDYAVVEYKARLRLRRFVLADAGVHSLATGYSVHPGNVSGGHMEEWTFRFGDEQLEVASWGIGDDRLFPRQLAARLGWDVQGRDD